MGQVYARGELTRVGIWNDSFKGSSTDFRHTHGHRPHLQSSGVTPQLTLDLFYSTLLWEFIISDLSPHSPWGKASFSGRVGWAGVEQPTWIFPKNLPPYYYPGIQLSGPKCWWPWRGASLPK